MIYFENSSRGAEGFNTHLISYTLCLSLSNFLERDFFFDCEIPSSTPPDYALKDEYKEKFKILLDSKRSLVSDLIEMPARRRFEIEREVADKLELQSCYFITTEELKAKFGKTMIWDSFAVGRIDLTRENLQNYDLIEFSPSKLANPSAFYFLNKNEKEELLKSVEIKYKPKIENLARKIALQIGKFNSFHLRLGDFLTNYHEDEYSVNLERFKNYVSATFTDKQLPVLAATDGLYEKELFAEMLKGFKVIFIDELVFDEYKRNYRELEFTDFNVLSTINQLLCAASENFIGTYRSTFTTIIHRLRQERFCKTDFNFFPDGKIAKILTSDYKIKADRQGFFDWNRYSIFSENHTSMAWMREWNFNLTSLNS